MNFFFQMSMLIGVISSVLGAVAYFAEFHNGRVTMSTQWKDLDRYQWGAVWFAIGGAVLLIASLILGAVTKGL
jgi:hypothetical protein